MIASLTYNNTNVTTLFELINKFVKKSRKSLFYKNFLQVKTKLHLRLLVT